MKNLVILILAAAIPLGLASINYAGTPSFSCATGEQASPITIPSSGCESYENFAVDFKEDLTQVVPTSDGNFGAAKFDYADKATLTINGDTYNSVKVNIRKGSEHTISTFQASSAFDFEIQIQFTSNANTVYFALLGYTFTTVSNIGDINAAKAKAATNNELVTVIPTTATNTINVKFNSILQTQINNKLAHDQYLNIYHYTGTDTSLTCTKADWYVYGTPVYMNNDQLDNIRVLTNNLYTGSYSPDGNGDNAKAKQNVITSTKINHLCFTGFFQNRMPENYGLWFCIGSIFGYFFLALSFGNLKVAEDYRENAWSHHPLNSIFKYGNDVFTRKTRLSLLLMTFIHHCLWNSVFYRQADDRTKGSNIIAFAIYSLMITWVIIYIYGFVLRAFYNAKYQYEKKRTEDSDSDSRPLDGPRQNNASDDKSQSLIFLFYVMIWITVWVGNGITIWNMNELESWRDTKASNYWVASVFISFVLDLLVFDTIVAWLATKSAGIKTWVQRKGYLYDDVCHKTFELSKKQA